MTVWVDADSCPVLLRNFVKNEAKNKNFFVHFVANRIVEDEQKNVKMTVCKNESNAADDFIVNNAQKNDIVVTRDIPFAARLVEKNISVMNEHGVIFTKDNIKDRLLEREFNLNLTEIGFSRSKKSSYSKKELSKFIKEFAPLLQKKIIATIYNC